jgi:hypothetical protein
MDMDEPVRATWQLTPHTNQYRIGILSFVMPGLVPGIHEGHAPLPWMAGTSPAMTLKYAAHASK